MLRLVVADHYELHRLVYEALARDGKRDFLFASVAVRGCAHRVLVRPCALATRFAEGDVFDLTLRGYPTVKHAGRRRSIGAAHERDPLAFAGSTRERASTASGSSTSPGCASSACVSVSPAAPSPSTLAATAHGSR